MKIFIDFDDVLFNTKKFKRDLIAEVFLRNGISEDDFNATYYTFFKSGNKTNKYYDPKKQINVLEKKKGIKNKKILKSFGSFIGNLEKYVFSDAELFLENFDKKDLFLLTYGDEKFQKIKVRGAGILKYFKKGFFGKFNKANMIADISKLHKFSPKESIILIDDLPEHLEKVKKRKKNIKTVHVRRREGRYYNLKCKEADYEVKNLKEAVKIIKKLS